MIEGDGVPLSVHLSAANRHNLKGLTALIGEEELLSSGRKEPSEEEPQHLCLDKAYDAEEADELLGELGYTGHIKRQGESDEDAEPGVASRFIRLGAGRWSATTGPIGSAPRSSPSGHDR